MKLGYLIPLILLVGCKSKTIQSQSANMPPGLTSEASRSNQQDTSTPQTSLNGAARELLDLIVSNDNLQDQIQTQQSRNTRLKRALGIGQIAACQRFTNTVGQIEVTINATPMSNVTSSNLPQTTISDDPTKALFKITVGNADSSKKAEIVFDQMKEDLLDQDRLKIITPATPLQVQDIEKISISKVTPVYQVIQMNPYQVRESQRYLIQRIRIQINNTLVYDNPNINFVLAKIINSDEQASQTGVEWFDMNVKTDENFLNFLSQGDCSAN